jgi:hypothetical protein
MGLDKKVEGGKLRLVFHGASAGVLGGGLRP